MKDTEIIEIFLNEGLCEKLYDGEGGCKLLIETEEAFKLFCKLFSDKVLLDWWEMATFKYIFRPYNDGFWEKQSEQLKLLFIKYRDS